MKKLKHFQPKLLVTAKTHLSENHESSLEADSNENISQSQTVVTTIPVTEAIETTIQITTAAAKTSVTVTFPN
ncbi:MAG: hypothetical protein LUE12_04505 [Ruminococcus sp.]|nr:hypothetical protein [Ruminococcus sp.]